MKTWELHTSSDGTMLSGIWEATPVGAYLHNPIELDLQTLVSCPRVSKYQCHVAFMSGQGTYHATFSAYEFVHMIYGRIVITPDDGTESFTVQGGDTFVVEADFKGTWKIEQAVRK
jgi:uncharacterized cupin superfamily protein